MPEVSVVIPTYNRASLLPQTIDSVLEQTYRDLEIIVVDDGSTDHTSDVLDKYSDKIRIIQQANRGEGEARNTGIRNANGKYIAFLDSDDVWVRTKIEKQVAILNHDPSLRWIYSDAYEFEGSTMMVIRNMSTVTRQPDGHIARQLLILDFIPSPTPIVATEVFDQVGDFSTLKLGADWDMWLRIAAHYPIAKVSECLAGYRIHGGMVSEEQTIQSRLESRMLVIRKAVNYSPAVYSKTKQRAEAFQHVLAGREYLKGNNREDARNMYIRAMVLSPFWWLPIASYLSAFLNQRTYHNLRTLRQRVIHLLRSQMILV